MKWIRKIPLYIPLLWFLIGFVQLPMLSTLVESFVVDGQYSLENYLSFIGSENGRVIISNTFLLGISTVIVCGIVGTFFALSVSLLDIKCKKFLHIILLTPIMIPGVLIVIAFVQLYGDSGIILSVWNQFMPFQLEGISDFTGILFVHAYTQYVYFYSNVSIALKYLDGSQIEAAKSMGASRWTIGQKIILPTILPALISCSIITFISGISSFSAPTLIGGGFKVLSTQIMRSKTNNYLEIASMQVVLLFLMGISVLLLLRYFERKKTFNTTVKSTPFVPIKLKSKGSKLFSIFVWIFALYIIVPLISIVALSFFSSSSIMTDIIPQGVTLENYQLIFEKSRVLTPFINSAEMTFYAVIATLAITVPIAYLSAKQSNRFHRFLEFLAMLPMTIPVSSVAINLINSFNRENVFSFGTPLIGTYIILPIAYVVLMMPVSLRTNMIAMGKFNIDLEYAARSLGASNLYTFITITLRQTMPAIIGGGILIFLRTVGEYNVSAFLYGVHNKPISIAMVSALKEYDIGLSMAYGTLTIIVCLFGAVLVQIIEKHFSCD